MPLPPAVPPRLHGHCPDQTCIPSTFTAPVHALSPIFRDPLPLSMGHHPPLPYTPQVILPLSGLAGQYQGELGGCTVIRDIMSLLKGLWDILVGLSLSRPKAAGQPNPASTPHAGHTRDYVRPLISSGGVLCPLVTHMGFRVNAYALGSTKYA